MQRAYYIPSGRLPARTAWLALRCVLAIVPAAWIYAWLTIHLPLILNLAVVPAFALGLGLATRYAVRLGPARNPLWMAWFGLALGLAAWYLQAAAWIALLEADSAAPAWRLAGFAALLADPRHIGDVAAALYETGAYSIAGIRVRGAVLVTAWGIELALLLGVPCLFGRMSAHEPFCEQSGCWMQHIDLPRKFDFVGQPAALAALLENEPDQLFAVLEPHPQAEPTHYATLTLYRGGGDPVISINNVVVRGDGRKKQTARRAVLAHLRLPGVDPLAVLRHGGLVDADQANGDGATGGAARAGPPELAGAIAALEADNVDGALQAARAHAESAQDAVRIDALRLCALSSARLGRWREALRYWRRLFGEEGTARNALNVGASYAMSGDPAHARDWIARARALNATSREMPDMQIVTSYIAALIRCGQMALALPYLEEVRALYTGLRNTDPAFLHVRQLPSFSVFLEHSAPVVRAALGVERALDWYASMLPHLDRRGHDELTAWMERQAFL